MNPAAPVTITRRFAMDLILLNVGRYPSRVTGSGRPAPLVLVVAYRSDAHLEGCLAALGGELDVLVVDNDASDETKGIVTSAGGSYLATPANVGFAAAVNAGLE